MALLVRSEDVLMLSLAVTRFIGLNPTPSAHIESRLALHGISFAPPSGWIAVSLPADAPVSFMWRSPDATHNGDSIAIVEIRCVKDCSLESLASRAASAMEGQGHSILWSHSQPACSEHEAGWALEVKIETDRGTALQRQELVVNNGKVYTVLYTRAASEAEIPMVLKSVTSLCIKVGGREGNAV